MPNVVDVRVEQTGDDGRTVGCTSLVRIGEEVVVSFALCGWPWVDEAPDVRWELADPDTAEPWPVRGMGMGTEFPNAAWRYHGQARFVAQGTPSVTLRCRRGDQIVFDHEIELNDLPAADCGVRILESTFQITDEHRQAVAGIAGAWSGRAIADFVSAISSPPSTVGAIVCTPIAIERWGEWSRLSLHLSGEVDRPDLPRWWLVELAGQQPVWTVLSGSSAPGGLLGHIAFRSHARPT